MKEIHLTKADFDIDTFRAGGKGGQHQNKTDSGVRITHRDTGLSAECRETRSQHQNKKIAFEKLAELILDYYYGEETMKRYRVGDEVVRTYHEPDDRVTDHASGEKFPFKHTVGKNDIDPLMEARRNAVLGGHEGRRTGMQSTASAEEDIDD